MADINNIRKWVDDLACRIGPRPFSSPDRLREVAGLLQETFDSFGYHVELQECHFRGNTYFNVVASPAGESLMTRTPFPLLVVGAHYDTVTFTPGADDNASAVAGLVELASILAPAPPRGLRLVAFCLEEPPVFRTRKMGSYRYAAHLKRIGQKVKGMICLEMIGYFTDRPGSQKFPFSFMKRMFPTTGDFIALVGNNRSRDFTKMVKAAFVRGTDLKVVSLNAPAIVIGIDFSDHWSFNKHRYPAVMVTDTAFYRNPNYHRPTDLPRTLDYVRLSKVVDGVVSAVQVISES